MQQPAKQLIGLFIIVLLFGVVACTPPIIDYYPMGETPLAEPELTGNDETQADGFQPATAVATATPLSNSNLLVPGEDGLQLAADLPITAVNYLFAWYGEAPPAYEYEQLVMADGRFQHGSKGDVTAQVAQLGSSLTALTPVDTVRNTYLWTDDYPEWHIEIQLADGRSLLIYSESTGFRGHAPWYILADGQLYWQTNGDIGFAVYDLLTEEAQDYFRLDELPFDAALLEPDERSTIYHKLPAQFSGLLPLASSFEYELDQINNIFSGTFVTNFDQVREYDTSSDPLQTVRQMQVGGEAQMQPCTLESVADEYDNVIWSFTCPLPATSEADVLQIEVSFDTVNGNVLTSTGQLSDFRTVSQE